MTDKFPPLDSADANDLQQLETLLADGLAPIPVAGERRNSLRQGLMTQVSASLAKQAGLLTVRARHGAWQALKTGIRVKPLWDGGLQGHSVLIEFAPGASLIPHRHNCLEEGIVLHGDLQMGDLRLGPLDYHASPAGSRHGGIRSANGALAYLRGTSLGDSREVLREVLAGLLPFGKAESFSVFTKQIDDWQEIAPGVWKKPLWQDGERESGFYRLEAGAKCPAHGHRLEEECMMLDGDLFIDDVLLRAGDYQLAPAGSAHREVYTDVGATLFVRGARDY
nr:cupin domain-containing protein [Methylomonas sp. MK1]